jgi:REP element-mobilizing transposase RayT
MHNPDIHHRRSIRLRNYDYRSAGAYFVTVCAFQRECLFGEVVDGEMRVNRFGEIVQAEWEKSAMVRENLQLDEFLVMPNHLHGIVIIVDDVGATRRVARNNADQSKRATQRVAPTGPVAGSVGAFLGQFKSIVTKRINTIRSNPGCPLWQRNYYEHIIRSECELGNIRRYIEENPLNWDQDENNPANAMK